MFGYLMALPQQLDEASLARYRSLYCGLCRALGRQYGLAGRMTLQYDLTFLAALLLSLQQEEETLCSARCVAHPIRPCAQVQSQAISYCAGVNVLLAYYKLQDDWHDEHSAAALAGREALKRAFLRAGAALPETAETIRQHLGMLSQMEMRGEPSADLPADCFGDLMGALFVPAQLQVCREPMRQLGFYLGRLIYMMDAFIDLRSDLKHGRYNPLSFVTALDAGLLDVLAGEAAQVYESLPLLRDKPMLDAIIYQGVWNRYNYERRRREKKEGRSSAHT